MRSARLALIAALSAMLLTLAFGPSFAEEEAPLEPWDQAAVTELAKQMAESVHGLRQSARRQPPGNIASGQEAARHRLLDRLRVIERETNHLAQALESGEGREATLPAFNRLDRERRKAAEEARRMFLPKETLERIQKSRGFQEQLRAYYTTDADAREDLHGPSKDGD